MSIVTLPSLCSQTFFGRHGPASIAVADSTLTLPCPQTNLGGRETLVWRPKKPAPCKSSGDYENPAKTEHKTTAFGAMKSIPQSKTHKQKTFGTRTHPLLPSPAIHLGVSELDSQAEASRENIDLPGVPGGATGGGGAQVKRLAPECDVKPSHSMPLCLVCQGWLRSGIGAIEDWFGRGCFTNLGWLRRLW